MNRENMLSYVRKRKRRKRAAIVSIIGAVGMLILCIIAFLMIKVDRFTIIANDPELCLTIDESRTRIVTKLSAPPVLNAVDTQYSEIPDDIDSGLGSKNEDHYFAYSFYLGGVGESKTINYSLSLTLEEASNELEDAMKIMIIRNGMRQIYAKANDDGSPKLIYGGNDHEEPSEILGSTIPFEDNRHIIWKIYDIKPGDYDKFTVVMWIDGWESVNTMKGGVFQADLKFQTESTIKED